MGRYEVSVRGELAELGFAQFADLELCAADGQTVLRGIRDQAELRAVLERVWNFGLELIRVEMADGHNPIGPRAAADDGQAGSLP
jgi:hypothetical protein